MKMGFIKCFLILKTNLYLWNGYRFFHFIKQLDSLFIRKQSRGILKPIGPDRTGPDRTGQDKTRQDKNKTGQDKTGHDRKGQDRTGQDKTGQDRTGPDRTGPGPARTGPDRTRPDRTAPNTGPDRTKRDGTGRDRTGPDGTGRDRTGPDGTGRTGQDRTGQERTGEDRTRQAGRDAPRRNATRPDPTRPDPTRYVTTQRVPNGKQKARSELRNRGKTYSDKRGMRKNERVIYWRSGNESAKKAAEDMRASHLKSPGISISCPKRHDGNSLNFRRILYKLSSKRIDATKSSSLKFLRNFAFSNSRNSGGI